MEKTTKTRIKIFIGIIAILALTSAILIACGTAQQSAQPENTTEIGDVKVPIKNQGPSNIEILEFVGNKDYNYNIKSITVFHDNKYRVVCWTTIYIDGISTACLPHSQLNLEK